MKFSVLIPVYNTEKYLEECLQSVLNQTYQDFEIILVDDGSTDNSGAICDKFQDAYPQKVKVIHKENQGQLASRCLASQYAKGQYCIFVDADDLLIDKALETICENLKKYSFPDMLVYSFLYDKENEEPVLARKFFNEGIIELDELHKGFYSDIGMNNVWTKAVKTNIARCKDFDFSSFYSLRCSEDTLYSMVMIDQCRVVAYIYEPLYRYRIWDDSISHQYTLGRIELFNDTLIYNIRLYYAEKWNILTSVSKKKLEADVLNYLVYVFDLFYTHINSHARKELLEYHWEKFVPGEVDVDNIDNNEYIPKTYRQLLHNILRKDKTRIRFYYLKKQFYQSLRELKRKLIHG